jgi:hypothetical protein
MNRAEQIVVRQASLSVKDDLLNIKQEFKKIWDSWDEDLESFQSLNVDPTFDHLAFAQELRESLENIDQAVDVLDRIIEASRRGQVEQFKKLRMDLIWAVDSGLDTVGTIDNMVYQITEPKLESLVDRIKKNLDLIIGDEEESL